MQAIRNSKCVFGRNLYDTDETNTILEISLTIYCPYLEEIKFSCLNVADCLNLRVVTLLTFLCWSHSVFFAVQIQEQKYYHAHCKIVH